MKRIVSISTIFLFSMVVFAQNPVFKNRYYPNGNLMYEGYFVEEKPVGTIKRYHENGKLKAIQQFATNDTVKVEYFAGDGSQLAKGLFVKGQKQGVWEYFSKENRLVMVENYKEGLKQGESLVFSESGMVIDRMHYENNVLHGKRIQYHPYGNVLATYSYSKGLLDGAFQSFYETGQKDEVGYYVANKKHGEWKTYNDDGSFTSVEYKNGIATNQTELDKKLQETMDKNEQGDPTIKDPADYLDQPDAYLNLFR
jgi:antitoxin component YwqK of YwqJK toxin-antitoxin module